MNCCKPGVGPVQKWKYYLHISKILRPPLDVAWCPTHFFLRKEVAVNVDLITYTVEDTFYYYYVLKVCAKHRSYINPVIFSSNSAK